MPSIKTAAKRWLPPILLESLKRRLRYGIYFSGIYADWDAAASQSSGYDSPSILECVRAATIKVISGQAAFERDSVAFDKLEHPFPVLTGLLSAAVGCENRLAVLDFGGSLGSCYFQCRRFISVASSLIWGVVEQEHFVRCGRAEFQTEQLKFFYTIEECAKAIRPNVALLSSVLQYVRDPDAILSQLGDIDVAHVVIDRTPFAPGYADFITVQHTPASIYRAAYPCRIFGEASLLDKLKDRFEVVARFDGSDGKGAVRGIGFTFGGMILRRI